MATVEFRNAAIERERSDAPALDCQLSVDTVLTRFPATSKVFDRFGIDRCCGGSLTVDHAARAHGVDSDILCSALREAIAL